MGNIVWVASYPKSGNTWMRVFLGNYLANQDKPVDINAIHTNMFSEANTEHFEPFLPDGKHTTDLDTLDICRMRPRVQANIAQNAHGSIFVKTHNFLGEYKGVPLHNSQVTSGAIFIVRNPLDVAVSMSNYFKYSIDDAIAFMSEEMTGTPNEFANVPQIISSWSNHARSWTEHNEDNIHVVRYEDMLANPLKVFRKVESFLNLKKDPKRLRRAIQFSSFDQLKNQENKRGFVEKFEQASHFFNKGKKDQWRESLNNEQIEKICNEHREMMTHFKYL